MFKSTFYIFIVISNLFCISLQEAYNAAEPGENYDKYLILDSETVYTGGLGIYEGDVFIDCNGAIIDLQSGQGIWVYSDEQYPSSLDIRECSIVNGLYYGLSYGGTAIGNVINCNFYSTNFGLKLFDNSDVYITNSVFIGQQSMGIGMYTEDPTITGDYILFWNNEDDCMENCPGWGNIWTQLELNPGLGIVYEDPLFYDIEQFDFNLTEDSPCIDTGNPDFLDDDGSISDIGATSYVNNDCSIAGDVNFDNEINVLDIVEIVNCILNSSCTSCNDLNDDNDVNVLDIVSLMNIILNQ